MSTNAKSPRSAKRVSKSQAEHSVAVEQTARLDTKFFATFLRTVNPTIMRQMTTVVKKENARRSKAKAA